MEFIAKSYFCVKKDSPVPTRNLRVLWPPPATVCQSVTTRR